MPEHNFVEHATEAMIKLHDAENLGTSIALSLHCCSVFRLTPRAGHEIVDVDLSPPKMVLC